MIKVLKKESYVIGILFKEIKSSILLGRTMSVCLKLKILVTTEPIGLYSSGIIPTGPVLVFNYFLRGWLLVFIKRKRNFLRKNILSSKNINILFQYGFETN